MDRRGVKAEATTKRGWHRTRPTPTPPAQIGKFRTL